MTVRYPLGLLAALAVVFGPLAADAADVRRVLVIPVELPNRAPVRLDRAEVARALFGPGDSVAARYRAISYGQVDFAGSDRDIARPVALAEPGNLCAGGLGPLADAAEDAARDRGIQIGQYRHRVFVLPEDIPCGWAGIGAIGGGRVWVKAATAKALRHELGHNLGLDHAVRWDAPGAEGSDFMGSGDGGLNAPHIVQLGWLRAYPAKVEDLTSSAVVTLEVLEADPAVSALPKVVIAKPSAGANTYYLSYRAGPDGEFTRGLNIHIFDPARPVGGLTYFVTSLTDGASYSDGQMVVQQVWHAEGDRVTFRISFTGTGTALPAGPPPAPPGSVQSVSSGKCLDIPRGLSVDGSPVIQFGCHGGTNQQWTLEPLGGGYRIISRLGGGCVASVSGGPVALSACGGSLAQLWSFEAGGALRNGASRLCLDVPGGSTQDGVRLITWACNGGSNQAWRYVPPKLAERPAP